MLFDSFEAYDVQETRKICKAEGQQLHLISLVCKKIQKNMSVPAIAEMLEETPETIQPIYDIALKHAPDYDAEKILEELNSSK